MTIVLLWLLLLRRKGSLTLSWRSEKLEWRREWLVYSTLLLLLFEPIRQLYRGTYGYNIGYTLIVSLLLLVAVLLFALVYDQRTHKDRLIVESFIRLYRLYFYYIISATAVVLLMATFNLINVHDWPLSSWFSTDFTNRISNPLQGSEFDYYTQPLKLIVIMANYIKVPIGPNSFGSFCGLSYEPHINMFFITPMFFLELDRIKELLKRILLIFLFSLTILGSMSLTNIIITLVLFILFNLIKLNGLRRFAFVIATLFLFITISNLNLEMFYKLLNKIDLSDSQNSGAVSVGYIDYILSPKNILGDGLFVVPDYRVNFSYWNIGIIYSLYFVFLYFFLISKIIKILKNHRIGIGLALLYVLLHSLKFPMHTILYPFFWFWIIIGFYPMNKLNVFR